ncbi:MAG TPA: tetratricopeptide repeat protein [Kofleriaceae bacterium]|nr:tetratricopeptide repeat protein [Kofleriaceae bacterium]
MTWTNLRLAILGLTVLASSARADQWVTPTAQTVLSPNQKLKAVITPAADGTSGATATIGEPGQLGKKFTLATRWMPVDVVLFDDGSLLALDHWHRLGYGQVATLYERDGTIRWSKTLVELVGQAVIDSVERSVSSIWWRKMPVEWSLAKDGKSGLITLSDENQLQLMLRDGSVKIVAVAAASIPDDPARLLNRARTLANQPGQEAAASAVLDRVLAKAPDHLEAVSLYLQILQRTSDHARAAALLDRLSPRWKTQDGYNLANVYVAWAASLTALSRKADAERVLRLAVTAAPGYTNPAVALAALLLDQGRRRDADQVLDDFVAHLLKASYLDSYSLATVADFYKQRGERAKALAHYLKGYKKDQVTNQHLYASLAALHEEMGDDAAAIRIHEQLLAYYVKQGSAFDTYVKSTRTELARLRAKRQRP